MKEFYYQMNQKIYYTVVFIMITLVLIGLFFKNPLMQNMEAGFFLHAVLAIIFITCLLLYPKYENHLFRLILIISTTAFLYTIFFLYPETSSTFLFLCFIPAFSIIFFDTKLFYFSMVLNTLSISLTFGYIALLDEGSLFFLIKQDIIGNVINFFGIQAIIYLIYYLSYVRIKKLELYYEQLQNSERLKTTGQLAAAVAHEIRNPLTVVKGFLQLYSEKDTPINYEAKEHFHLMIDELNSAEQVISQFLSIAKPDKNKQLDIVNVKVVLQSVTDLLKSYGLLHDNTIELHVEEDCFITINHIEYKQLMINIIKNAIEASKLGDSVLVHTRKLKHSVEITVIDNGAGMSDEQIKSLGTPFYSLKSTGTGLGLMICYHIIEKYDGTIHFHSEEGNGTTVTIQFPSVSL